MTDYEMQRASSEALEAVLELLDSVQVWPISRGLKEQWGDTPFSQSEGQRQRFTTWLADGRFFLLRDGERIVGTLVFSPEPPDYARSACAGRASGGYLEAFAVHRDCAGPGCW